MQSVLCGARPQSEARVYTSSTSGSLGARAKSQGLRRLRIGGLRIGVRALAISRARTPSIH
eukprot:5769612-Alexandrium_andersonii.AAC.1